MATTSDKIIAIVKRYVAELEKNQITIRDAIIFGSHIKGTAREWSDIDVALVSPAFTGDRFDDRRRIVPLRRKIDNSISFRQNIYIKMPGQSRISSNDAQQESY